ncbi:hypothetical protein PR048_030105 [Dryococelus australis]|uniref:Uncharacterized protein n=1 Tax=Dryococelus australis TaxID=614101 RepID=A0ABQ9G807_9NEOP|nr:hypothetical protein PR048_030105 [Dryococelus australis]
MLVSHQGEPGSILGRVTGFSQVGIVPDDAVGRRVFSGISSFPRHFIPAKLHTSITLTGSQDLAVKSRPKIFTSPDVQGVSSHGGGPILLTELEAVPDMADFVDKMITALGLAALPRLGHPIGKGEESRPLPARKPGLMRPLTRPKHSPARPHILAASTTDRGSIHTPSASPGHKRSRLPLTARPVKESENLSRPPSRRRQLNFHFQVNESKASCHPYREKHFTTKGNAQKAMDLFRISSIYLKRLGNMTFWPPGLRKGDEDGEGKLAKLNYGTLYQYWLMEISLMARAHTEANPMRVIEVKWSSAGMNGRTPKKTHRPMASSSTIPTCENPD